MNNYLISDMHLGHYNIIKLGERPFNSLDEMHTVLIDNWNNTVNRDDTIFCLGDSFWSPMAVEYLLPRLKGRIVFLRGNHDANKTWKTMKEICPEHIYIDSPYFETYLHNYHITFCHYPMYSWNGSGHKDSWHFHGHIHQKVLDTQHPQRINVSVEAINYTPVNIKEYLFRATNE